MNSIQRVRMALMCQQRPTSGLDYTELPRIVALSNGPYIDTNYYANNNTKYVLDGKCNNRWASGIFGNSSSEGDTLFGCSSWNNIIHGYYGSNDKSFSHPIGAFTITLDAAGFIFTQNGTTQTEVFTDIGTFQNTVSPCCIGRVGGSTGRIEIYRFKIYENNILIKDFVPAILNTTGELGVVDIINQVFYANAGTGEFTQ